MFKIMKLRKYRKRKMNKSIPKVGLTDSSISENINFIPTPIPIPLVHNESEEMDTQTVEGSTVSDSGDKIDDQIMIIDTNNDTSQKANETPVVNLTQDESDEVIVLDSITNEKSEPIVIDLDDYEEKSRKKKKRASNRCINFECDSGENFRRAPLFTLNYYRVKVKRTKIQEVCDVCFEDSLCYHERLMEAVKCGQYLVEQEFPIRDECVEIDSDEENNEVQSIGQTYDCELSDEVVKFLEDELPDAMNEVMSKYKIEDQIRKTDEFLDARQKKLNEALQEIEDIGKDFQRRVDTIRSQLYETFKYSLRELPSIEIIDVHAGSALQGSTDIHSPTIRREAERRSNRNTIKPVSYCELVDDVDPVSTSVNPPASVSGSCSASGSVTVTVAQETVVATDVQIVNSAPLPAFPPRGTINRPRPVVGEIYFAMRQSVFGAWGRVRLLEIIENSENYPTTTVYRVKFEGKTKGLSCTRVVSGKQLSYAQPSSVRIEVGTRVIAVFTDDSSSKKEYYFTGVIAEPLSSVNLFRYLVFFDDGYAQYVKHEKVLVVIESSKNVWEDIHPDSRLFIRKYLEIYPERPMVKLQSGQVVKTEWNGKWWIARVLRVDGSLAHMYFDADARSEWIYRGSTRLGPLFLEMQGQANRQERGSNIPKTQNVRTKAQNLPYVEYTRSQRETDSGNSFPSSDGSSNQQHSSVGGPPRAVARKSTNRPANTLPQSHSGSLALPPTHNSNMVPFLPTPQVQQPQSKVVYFAPKSVVTPKLYDPHVCSPKCLEYVTISLSALKGYNPLSKPLLCGWHRLLCKYKGKKVIRYRAPCSRSIRSLPELHQYLRITKSDMSVDMFDFDYWVHCLAEFVLDKTFRSKRDISNGVENVPIPCVNYVDNTLPDFCNYSTKREPMEGVDLNLEEDFLCGCECEDDCADRSRCACWQLTIREARTLNRRLSEEHVGYIYKRLPEFVTTGIYECNSRCKCAATCLNRVVQHPLQLKLQLFKTANRGWGIRCLNDIPHGAFICIYAGSLLTDKMANEGGVNYGDEYLAELDYIEVVERQKEGYESDVTDIEDEDGGSDKYRRGDAPEEDDDDYDDHDYEIDRDDDATDFVYPLSALDIQESSIRTRSRKRTAEQEKNSGSDTSSIDQQNTTRDKERVKEKDTDKEDDTVTISDDEENVREPSSFAPSSETKMDDSPTPPRFKSVRKMFGEDEMCYTMDAKNTGNIGRFLNHSCSPNVFVQNVFVDTHDLRFPWVAFFAMHYIRAGTELTWNYNYDVGSVPGKVIFCHCGSSECRGRLL